MSVQFTRAWLALFVLVAGSTAFGADFGDLCSGSCGSGSELTCQNGVCCGPTGFFDHGCPTVAGWGDCCDSFTPEVACSAPGNSCTPSPGPGQTILGCINTHEGINFSWYCIRDNTQPRQYCNLATSPESIGENLACNCPDAGLACGDWCCRPGQVCNQFEACETVDAGIEDAGVPWMPPPNVCDGPIPARESDGSKGAPGITVGDPVVFASGTPYSFDRLEDLAIITPAGRFAFHRTYYSSDEVWRGVSTASEGYRLRDVPKPFGSSRENRDSLRWTHSLFSFVDVRNLGGTDAGAYWVVRPPIGTHEEFAPCTGSPCLAGRTTTSPGQSNRLQRLADGGFEYLQSDGRRHVYGAPTADGGLYFLTEVSAHAGAPLALLEYQKPTPCVALSSAGVPWVWRVHVGGTQQLTLAYETRPSLDAGNECVLTAVKGADGGSLVSYGYEQGKAGLLGAASTPAYAEGFTYDAGFTVTRAGAVLVSHTGSVVGAFADRAGEWGLSVAGAGSTTDPCASSMVVSRTVTNSAPREGTGADVSAGLSQLYTYMSGHGVLTGAAAPLSRVDACAGSVAQSCSPGTEYWRYSGVDPTSACGPGNPGYLYATRNKLGHWTVTPMSGPDGGASSGFERRAVWVGVPGDDGGMSSAPGPGVDGANALERTDYTYTYMGGRQLVATERRPSVLGTETVTSYFYDGAGRLVRKFQAGKTRALDGSVLDRVVGRFWSYNGSGLLAEESGPCFVANTSVTACPSPADAPSTSYAYHLDAGSDLGHLKSVTRKVSSSQSLTTQFGGYTAQGDPSFVIDESGVKTEFTYQGRQVTSRTIADAGIAWAYSWDNEKLVALTYPEGNVEAYCYRALAGPADPCTGAWVGRLTRVSKATATDGVTGWTEATLFTYWQDGTLKSETRYLNEGGTPQARFTRTVASDAHGRQTLDSTGVAGQSFQETRGYDGADNLAAIGAPYNAPPSFCSAGGALSPLCAQLGYDRAQRLRQLDVFPTASSSNPIRTCIDYDARGNVSQVTTGCSNSDTCARDASASSCSGQPASSYVTDDFGNVIEVRPVGSFNPSTGQVGVFRFEFDASGNLIAQQTEAQRSEVPTHTFSLEHSYDLLGRRTQTREVWNSTSHIVSEFSYGSDGPSPPTGCEPTANTLGRLRRSWDPLMTRWYQYDEAGRVTREIRVPTGATDCSVSYDLGLSYTANGNLRELRHGHGRTVSYEFGDGAAKDRPKKILASRILADGGTEQQSLIENIRWEPYGNLRAYTLRFEDGTTGLVDYELGQAGTSPASNCLTGALTEGLDQTNRLRSLRVMAKGNEMYRKTYRWAGDQVVSMATCYKGNASNTIIETLDGGYDSSGRLGSSVIGDFANSGGPYKAAAYAYDSRGNATQYTVTQQGHAYTMAHPTQAALRDRLTSSAWAGTFNRTDFAYDRDGRTSRIFGPNDSSGAPGAQVDVHYMTDSSISPGSLSALRETGRLTAGATVYHQHWYDNVQRRQARTYPINDAMDLYLYDLGHQLLEDRGIKDLANPSPQEHPLDEYVWLDGRPVAIYRSMLDSSYRHKPDQGGLCTRMGESSDCGAHFVISDHLSKPVLVLNPVGKVAGVGEYEPNGNINRVQWWFMYGFPYTQGASGPYWSSFNQPSFGMEVDFRNHFTMLDTEADCNGNLKEGPSLWNGPWDTMHWALYGYHQGDTWSRWVTGANVGSGRRGLTLGWGTANLNCLPGCDPQVPCPAVGSGWNYMGFVHREWEYRRYDTGAKPYFPPLRFPGHYWDADTDLFENWHRNYYPFEYRYLSPEPLLQSPAYVRQMAQSGLSVPTYAYALNNPLRYVDPTGLDAYIVNCGGNVGHTELYVDNACYGPESGAGRSVLGGGFYCAGWPEERSLQCVFAAPGEWRWTNSSFIGTTGSMADRCNQYDRLQVTQIPLSCEQTAAVLDRMRAAARSPQVYSALSNNCHDVAQDIAFGDGQRCLVPENGRLRSGPMVPLSCPR